MRALVTRRPAWIADCRKRGTPAVLPAAHAEVGARQATPSGSRQFRLRVVQRYAFEAINRQLLQSARSTLLGHRWLLWVNRDG
jgi:hypothetical protein